LWGKPIKSRSWSSLWFPRLFFPSYLSIALVALVRFQYEGLEHLCSCHCIGCISLSSPRRFGGESKKLISSWVLGTLDGLVDFLGSSNLVVEIFPSFVVPPWRLLGASNWVVVCAPILVALWIWEPPIKLWSCPQALCGFGDRPQGSHSGSGLPSWWEGSRRLGWAFVAFGEPLCLHTTPTEISSRKGVNFEIHRCLRVFWLFLYPSSFTYEFYFVIAFVLEVIYIYLPIT
jgi:hypothetical protein